MKLHFDYNITENNKQNGSFYDKVYAPIRNQTASALTTLFLGNRSGQNNKHNKKNNKKGNTWEYTPSARKLRYSENPLDISRKTLSKNTRQSLRSVSTAKRKKPGIFKKKLTPDNYDFSKIKRAKLNPNKSFYNRQTGRKAKSKFRIVK